MSLRIGRFTAITGLILLLTLVAAAPASFAQGKPAYDADVEAVARTMFLELLSPY